MTGDVRASYESIHRHSKSFSLASRLLPPSVRLHAVSVYAWCRRADDAVDLESSEAQPGVLAALVSEIQAIYRGEPFDDPILSLFQRTVEERAIPKAYPLDLLAGMEMDVRGRRYASMEDLFEYCYHVAGCVGLMMCHVMGVRDDSALPNAAHLGMAMQLTNICRDVEEDWGRNRLYIPEELLAPFGAPGLADRLGEPFPAEARRPLCRAIEHLLLEADRCYASGDAGMRALSGRCALAIRAARRVYAAIGDQIRRTGHDPLAGRAFVSFGGKLWLILGALAESAAELRWRLRGSGGREPATPRKTLGFRDVRPGWLP